MARVSLSFYLTQYTDETPQITKLIEETNSIAGFVYGVKIKSFVKFLSTKLLKNYDGLMKKLYSWLQVEETTSEGRPITFMDSSTGDKAQKGRLTAKIQNDIMMFQQHQGESLSEAWTRFKDLLQKVPHHGIDLWLQVQIFYDHVNHDPPPQGEPSIKRRCEEGLDGFEIVIEEDESRDIKRNKPGDRNLRRGTKGDKRELNMESRSQMRKSKKKYEEEVEGLP
ncbi:zinc finger, CCHC-type containing protein [Tanacetum coccineum]